MEKRSLSPLELGCRDGKRKAVFAVHADETHDPPKLVLCQGLSEPKGHCVPWSKGWSK